MRQTVRITCPNRWDAILELHRRIEGYHQRVKPEEQPFRGVSDLIETARRRKETTSHLGLGEEDVLQTKGALQATALGLRLYIALLVDFVSLARHAREEIPKIQLNLRKPREECENLIRVAAASNRLSKQVEGHVFLVQLFALERTHPLSADSTDDHLQRANTSVLEARRLCNEFPGQTQGLAEEVDNAEQMLQRGAFYAAVSNEERMAVIAAMAQEFRGTGHWYYCRNGHPFTIGECGGAVQTSSCPEYGAPVGGIHHVVAEGVTRADEFERGLENMNL